MARCGWDVPHTILLLRGSVPAQSSLLFFCFFVLFFWLQRFLALRSYLNVIAVDRRTNTSGNFEGEPTATKKLRLVNGPAKFTQRRFLKNASSNPTNITRLLALLACLLFVMLEGEVHLGTSGVAQFDFFYTENTGICFKNGS